MTILVDLNQIIFANVMQQANSTKTNLDENIIRHMILNSLRMNIKQFRNKYGKEVILACDSKKLWRRDYFPYYKANRKKDRDNSKHDWTSFFVTINIIREELKEYFPYKVLEVVGAEADDIIGVLAKKLSVDNEVLILSSDKDFGQLQKYKNVDQYNPIQKKFVVVDDPELCLKEHIMRGDRSDGVPNFLSADSTFVAGERQKVINSKKMSEWIKGDPVLFCDNAIMRRGYTRNRVLIDLDYVPEQIELDIIDSYNNTKTGTKYAMMNYFVKNRLRSLLEVIDEF
jgi:5'-3' exonuclease